MKRMTRERRIAIGEIIRVVAVLTNVRTPFAKQIAAMVLRRLEMLAEEDAALEPAGDDAIATFLVLAQGLRVEPQPDGEAGA